MSNVSNGHHTLHPQAYGWKHNLHGDNAVGYQWDVVSAPKHNDCEKMWFWGLVAQVMQKELVLGVNTPQVILCIVLYSGYMTGPGYKVSSVGPSLRL